MGVYMSSIWDKTIKRPERKPLPGNTEADVVVVGAGICGILTAYYLKQEGKKVIVVEADTVGGGQTHNTTAKITAQHGLFLDTLVQTVGYSQAKQYTDVNRRAINEYENLIRDNKIDCDFLRLPSLLYTCVPKGEQALAREKTSALTLGVECEYGTSCDLPFPVKGVLSFPGQAQFNPLPFLYTLAGQLEIYEHTKALSTDSHTVYTDKGTISCGNIVFACHFPFRNFPGYYFLRMHQERSYIAAVELPPSAVTPPAGSLSSMYYGIDDDGLSFRQYKNTILIGGQGHRTGKNTEPHRYDYLKRKAKEYWPDSRIACTWSAQDCMPLDNIPYIGVFSSKQPDWYIATGFKKWGMTSAMAAALILRDLICGRPSPYGKVFSPNRPLYSSSLKTLRTEIKEVSTALSREFLTRPGSKEAELETLHRGESRIVSLNGKKVGIYRDQDGRLYAVSTKCPHLGCQLGWNPEELTWDCPCHGSRFDYKGNLIDGPAQEGCRTSCSLHKH